MKYHIIGLFLFLCLGLTAQEQKIGIRLGGGYSTMFDQKYKDAFKPSYIIEAGLYGNKYGSRFGFRWELGWAQHRTHVERFRKVIPFNYVNLAIAPSFIFKEINSRVYLGGYAGLLLKRMYKIGAVARYDFNSIDAGLMLGYEFPITDFLKIDLRGRYGLASMYSNSEQRYALTPGSDWVRNFSATIGIVVAPFDLKGQNKGR